MAWVSVGLGVAGALLGHQQHQAQLAAQEADAQRASATERYSPWTHLQANAIRHPSSTEFGSLAGGGLSGFMQGQAINNAMAAKPGVPGGGMDPSTGANALGGQNMAAQMGQDAQMPAGGGSPWFGMQQQGGAPNMYQLQKPGGYFGS
jgi:hypothetical protein